MPNAEAVKQVRENMVQFGFPPRLLPDGVAAFTWDPASGRFTITLDAEQRSSVAGYTVIYARTISGVITERKIGSLTGVNVKVALLKPAVTEIRAAADKSRVTFGVAGMVQPIPWSTFA